MGGGAAGDRVCVGEQLAHLERLGESCVALAAGEIGFAHLALIARTSAAVGERLNERKLLRKASELSVGGSATPACMSATRPTPRALSTKRSKASRLGA
jgi:hypothetical protein